MTDHLRQAEHAQSQSDREKESLQHYHDELRLTLRHQLSRSKLLNKAYKKEVSAKFTIKCS